MILDEKKMESNKLRGMQLPTPRFLLDPLSEDLQKIRGYKNLQTFFPAMTKVFKINKFQSDQARLDTPWQILSVDCSGNQGFCHIMLKEGEAVTTKPAYLKVTHLLDPVRWMKGGYSLPKESGLPWHSKTWTAAWHKIQDPWNQAYVEVMATYALSKLRIQGISPHFNYFYGSFCAKADLYRYNINDDFSSFRNTRWFWKGSDRGLYTLTVLKNGSADDVPQDVRDDLLTRPEYQDEDEDGSSLDSIEYQEGDEEASLHSASLESMSFAEDEDENEEEDEEYAVYASIPNFPVMLIFTEPNEDTMDSLLNPEKHTVKPGSAEWEIMWSAWIFQVIAAECVMQKVFGMTHNDLHTNNIVWSKTDLEYLYYKDAAGVFWKVPTYGKIFRLIDFGRSIFSINNTILVSDDFRAGNDADGQYSFPPLHPKPREVVPPNPSFDLSRLSVSLFESLFPVKPEDSESRAILSEEEGLVVRESVSPLYNVLWSWMVDDDDRNILVTADGDERFPDFDLYKHIAAKVHNAVPSDQVYKAPFSQFQTKETVEKAYSLFI